MKLQFFTEKLKKLSMLARVKIAKKKVSYREKILVCAVIAVVLFIWASSLMSGFSEALASNRHVESEVAKNELFLSTGTAVRARLNEKARELHAGTEMSGTDLLSIIESLGAETSLKPENSSKPISKTEGPFDIITVRITLRNAPLENLIEFDERISNEYTSVAVTQARFVPVGTDGQLLTATYEITAFLLRENAKTKP